MGRRTLYDDTNEFGKPRGGTAVRAELPDRNRDSRHAHIRGLQKSIAVAELATLRHGDVVARIQAIEIEKMRYADDHMRSTAPIQKELGEIDKSQTALILAGKPVDAKAENRRRELIESLNDKNDSLEIAIETADKKLSLLHAERVALAPKCNAAALRADRLQLGPPALVRELYQSTTGGGWRSAAEVEAEILAEQID